MLRLKTFGQPLVERDGVSLGGAARQRRVLAVLAVVAAGRERGVSRDRVLALLWPEREAEKARQALTQSLYHARRALGQDDLFIASADLRLNPDVIASDRTEFEEAMAAGDLARAVELYQGSYLDGFHVTGAAEFERWVSGERERLRAQCTGALEALAVGASEASDFASAVVWRKRLAAMDSLNSRIALELMRAMAATGDRAGAIRHAQIHESLLRAELDASPHPAITEMAEALRHTSTWVPGAAEQRGESREALLAAGAAGAAIDPAAEPNAMSAVARLPEDAWGGERADVSRPAPAARPRSDRRALMVAAIVLAMVTAAIVLGRLVGRQGSPVASNVLVVAPFRVSGAESSLGYLHEGLVDLLATLVGDHIGEVADPGAVMSAWRRAGLADRSDVARDEALRVATGLGGTRMVLGSVVGVPKHLVITATLLAVPSGEVRAQASADGSADSLTAIVDKLVTRLLVEAAGERDRLVNHTSASPAALRAYLDGQAAYRRGSYRAAVRDFRRALERDSAFATAALALANAADRIDAPEDRAHGLTVAWAGRERLTERDRLYLDALGGPRHPAPSSARDFLAAWERAAALAPDRADVWHELGELLFYDGQTLSIGDWPQRATAAFRRAAELDESFASPLQYLVQLAAARRDTAAVRASAAAYLRLDSIGELAPFVRWRAAVALADEDELAALRHQFTRMPPASLRAIVLSSQYNGIAIEDADRAVAALASRAARWAERSDVLLARHALALNRGEPMRAAQATSALGADRSRRPLALRLHVLDYLYGGGDSTVAVDAAARLLGQLQREPGRRPAPDSGADASRPSAADACVLTQLRAWTIPFSQSDTVVSHPLDGMVTVAAAAELPCASLVDAIAASRTAAPDAAQIVARADSLLFSGTGMGETRDYAGIALARLYEVAGDPSRALAAVRRRPYMLRWPHYLALHLREEGRLATLAGDTARAAAAYRHYLAIRPSPEATVQPEVDTVRADLARLAR